MRRERFASIDVGTNSVLLLVAERQGDGSFVAVDEAMELTRLGRGVDRSGVLAEQAMEATLEAVARFAARARAAGAQGIAISATSAARDAKNGATFLDRLRERTGVEAEILSGEEEARLSFASASRDFGGGPLSVVDIGGGSTEWIQGEGDELHFRTSLDLGCVRLTERWLAHDPPLAEELEALRGELDRAWSALPPPPAGSRLVGIAGTVTTLCALHLGLDAYEGGRVHGEQLRLQDLRALTERLSRLSLEERLALPGLPPRRADVIVAGAWILQSAMERMGYDALTVSDRGLRWGLLYERFG